MDKNKRPKLYTLPDTFQAVQPCRRHDLIGVVCLVSSTDRCSVSSAWACVSVRGAVCLAFGAACPAACAV